MYVGDHNINAYVSSAHKINEEGQVKAGKVKPGENILHLKGTEAAQLHVLSHVGVGPGVHSFRSSTLRSNLM